MFQSSGRYFSQIWRRHSSYADEIFVPPDSRRWKNDSWSTTFATASCTT
jgi:hypothetical protein